MKICFLPIDNRPVCYSLANDIAAIDEKIELLVPPRSALGSLTKSADVDNLMEWLSDIPECDSIVLSLDTIAYGGLIPSRRSPESFEKIKNRIFKLKNILADKHAKIYAFSSIMRISNNNYNEEEKDYWKDYGKLLFEYSYNFHKNKKSLNNGIPKDILDDYLKTRERNFKINKIYLDWQKEGFFKTLIFSKDDCAEYGFNVMESQELEAHGGFTKTGADEIPLSLLAKALKKDIKVFVKYTEPDYKNLISNYEDISIEKCVMGQLELCGFKLVKKEDDADLILIVNNFQKKQGELVMGWGTEPFNKNLLLPPKPYAVADVRFANGADNKFVEKLITQIDTNFYGFASWNTSANTLGSLLACIKFKFNAEKYSDNAFKKLQAIRLLDDWAYQANVRGLIDKPQDIKKFMIPYENKISEVLKININPQYTYPWDRKFEIEITL